MFKIVMASTASVAVILLSAGCGLGPAVPSPAEAESAAPPRRSVDDPHPRVDPAPKERPLLYSVSEPTEEGRKGVLLILSFGARR